MSHNHIFPKLCLFVSIIAFVAIPLNLQAQNPKREFRATWLTTVRNVDWPTSPGSSVTTQKNELIRMLDSLQTLNMNVVCFQVRCNADAFYQSDYEPWSALLTGTRGKDPGYDPLQFCIEECHKRGMQCQAWLNPYRYNNKKAMWNDNCAIAYEYTHPDWLFMAPNDNCVVMDPGHPEVRKRVKEVVGDIINKYDVDGILFDDYFYPYGGTTNQDAATAALYKPEGMPIGDWRRENVRMMVQDVFDTIQAVKPYVAFGISPFGTWTNDTYVARIHGLTLPKGVTSPANMYAEIYCDPITWLEDGTVDYISPQLYWPTSHSANPYDKLCPWWADVANRFNRHFYSSMSTDSYSRGVAGFTMLEMRTETDINRQSSTDGAFGFIFFNTKAYIYDSKFRYQFSVTRLSSPALPPAFGWKSDGVIPPPLSDLQLVNRILTWRAAEGKAVRYAVYAVPRSWTDSTQVFSRADVLLGIAYSPEYLLPEYINPADYRIAVSVLDGYWNEYSLRVLGEDIVPERTTTLLYPLGAEDELSWSQLLFRWQPVDDAYAYEIQIATDDNFRNILASQEITATSFNAENRLNLALSGHGDYFWRVRTKCPNMQDTWSDAKRFTINSDAILSATDNIHSTSSQTLKTVENGVFYIYSNGAKYNIFGQKVK